jgi:hypothetical protein
MPRLIVLLLFFITITTSAYAAWTEPVEIISGKWGTASGEFEYEQDYIEITLPHFKIDAKSKNIIVADVVNKRIKIYTQAGSIVNIFGPTIPYEIEEGWPGNLLGVKCHQLVDTF